MNGISMHLSYDHNILLNFFRGQSRKIQHSINVIELPSSVRIVQSRILALVGYHPIKNNHLLIVFIFHFIFSQCKDCGAHPRKLIMDAICFSHRKSQAVWRDYMRDHMKNKETLNTRRYLCIILFSILLIYSLKFLTFNGTGNFDYLISSICASHSLRIEITQ